MEQQIQANKRKTAFLVVCLLSLLLIFAAVLLWLSGWMASALGSLVLVGYIIISYASSVKRILKFNKALLVDRNTNRELYEMADNISISLGIKTPPIYVINDPALNAFAAGHSPQKSVVGITTGLLETLNKQELEGVLAHEFGHIVNRDIRISTLAFAVTAGFLFLIDISFSMFWGSRRSSPAPFLLALGILGFVFATLIRLAISRRREYLADVTGAQITRYPAGLVGALEKIAQHGSVLRKSRGASAHLFLSNPLKQGFMSKILNTHPPLEDRIDKLKQLESRGY